MVPQIIQGSKGKTKLCPLREFRAYVEGREHDIQDSSEAGPTAVFPNTCAPLCATSATKGLLHSHQTWSAIHTYKLLLMPTKPIYPPCSLCDQKKITHSNHKDLPFTLAFMWSPKRRIRLWLDLVSLASIPLTIFPLSAIKPSTHTLKFTMTVLLGFYLTDNTFPNIISFQPASIIYVQTYNFLPSLN